jgi:hypothetical protein
MQALNYSQEPEIVKILIKKDAIDPQLYTKEISRF